jgi:membrane protein DedA with SNARE-associated domain
MAKVSIWAQWLGVAAGVLLSSAFAVFLGWFIGWSHFRRWCRRRKIAPRAVSGDPLRRAETVGWIPRTQASTTSAKRSRNYKND